MHNTIELLGLTLPVRDKHPFVDSACAEISPEQLKELIDSNRWKKGWRLPKGVKLAVRMFHDEPLSSVSSPQEFRDLVATFLIENEFRNLWNKKFLQGKAMLGGVSLKKSDIFPTAFPKDAKPFAYMMHPLTGKPVFAGYRPKVDWSRLPNFVITFHLMGPWEPEIEKRIADDVRNSFETWKRQ